MGEWKRTLWNRRLPALLAAAVLLNLLLFLGEQKAAHYMLDFSKPLAEGVESIAQGVGEDTYLGTLSEREAYRRYLHHLRAYQDVPLTQALEALTDKKEELIHMSTLFQLFAQRESAYGKARWEAYQRRYPDLAQRILSGQASQHQMMLDYVAVNNLVAQLEYLCTYPEYLQSIQDNRQTMLSFPMFHQDDGFSRRNVCKTADDFGVLTPLALELGADGAVVSLFSFPLTDYFLLLILGVAALSFLAERKQGLWSLIYALPKGRLRLGVHRLGILLALSCASVLLLYGSTLLAGFCLYGGLHDLHRPIQSISIFGNLPIPGEIGPFLLQYLCFRMAAASLIAMLLWLVFSLMDNVKYTLLAGSAFLAVEYGLHRFLPQQSVFNLFKYFNVFTYITSSDLYTRYLNINVFGFPWSIRHISELAAVPLAVVLGAGCVLVQAYKRPSQGGHLLERAAYALNRLWDAFFEKLPLWGMELYKILLLQRGAAVVLLVLYLACTSSYIAPVPPSSEQEVYEQQFLARWGGELCADTFLEMERLQADLERTIAQYTQAAEDYDRGALSFSDYTLAAYEGERAQQKLEALHTVRARAAHLQALGAQRHFTPYLLDETPFQGVYGQPAGANQQLRALLALAAMVLLLGGAMAYEGQSGVIPLLASTPRGRRELLFRKAAAAALLAVTVGGAMYAMETYSFSQNAPPELWGAAVQNLSDLERFPFPCSVRGFVAGLLMFRLLALFSYGLTALALSSCVNRPAPACLLGFAVLVLPSLLYHYIDLDVFRYGAAALPLEGIALLLPTQGGGPLLAWVFVSLWALPLSLWAIAPCTRSMPRTP